MSNETMAEQHSHHDSGVTGAAKVIETLAETIRARREMIRDEAPCEGCGATARACLDAQGKDPAAPPWFGCCAQGADMRPCRHVTSADALTSMLREIETGRVRTVAEVLAARPKRAPLPEGMRRGVMGNFDQGTWWHKRDGSWTRIAEMTPGHRYNSAAMLMRHAPLHGLRYSLAFGIEAELHDGGDMAHESLGRAADELALRVERDAAGWLRGTALYRALADGLTIQGDGTKPWQATGRDPVTGDATEVPPAMSRSCEIPACGCSGEAHA